VSLWLQILPTVASLLMSSMLFISGNINQRKLKMKGIEVPEAETTTAAADSAEAGGPGSGRKRLYHVLKYGAQNAQQEGADKAGGGGGGGGGGGAGGKGGKSQGNRAGFEGKKREYLNKQ
jgi:hypothetical protein